VTWNNKELEENIETLFGKEQRELLSPCLETIEGKEFYATYHCDEVERLINEELKGLEPDDHKLLNVREGTEEHGKVLLVIRKALFYAETIVNTHATLTNFFFYALGVN
jgi:hypothetical protein